MTHLSNTSASRIIDRVAAPMPALDILGWKSAGPVTLRYDGVRFIRESDLAALLPGPYYTVTVFEQLQRMAEDAGHWRDHLASPVGICGKCLNAYKVSVPTRPIDMVLFCPACGVQHIDEADSEPGAYSDGTETMWTNPPHRSHLCHNCKHIWRPADVPTNGVKAIKTQGKKDSPPIVPRALPVIPETFDRTERVWHAIESFAVTDDSSRWEMAGAVDDVNRALIELIKRYR